MKALPENLMTYKRTPFFSIDSIPAGLLKSHSTKKDTWAKICITKGRLHYVIESNPEEVIELDATQYGVVEPEQLHHVEVIQGEDVEFYVEFLREK